MKDKMYITDIFTLLFCAILIGMSSAGYDCVDKCTCTMKNKIIIADCSARNLSEVPIPKDHQVNVLILNLNRLTKIRANAFALYTALTTVDLSQNQISLIEVGAFNGLGESNLLHLDLSQNYLKRIPETEISRISHSLHSLSLASNAIRYFPTYIKYMPQLLKFDISNNLYITSLSVDGLPSTLTSLNIAFTSIRHFSKANFRNASMLRELDMSDNSASGAVDFQSGTFDNLARLQYLDLSRCYCRRLPGDSFVKLKNLSTLLLASTRINKLPVFYTESSYFPNETEGHSGEQPIKTDRQTLDQENDGLSRKKRSRDSRDRASTVSSLAAPELDLFGDNRNEWSNPQLHTLDLSNNRRLSIKPGGEMGGNIFPPSMLKLELGYTAVRSLNVQSLANLHNLNYLGLCYSRISSIAEEAFLSLSQLRSLCLSGNQFKTPPTLPDSVENINMTNTKITTLTRTYLGGLDSLYEADWSNGVIENIETGAFENMTALKTLNLSTNTLEIIMEDTFAIRPFQNTARSSLELLDLSNNQILAIHGSAFVSHGGLQELHIQDNRLEEIADLTFKGLLSLEVLNLARNNILDIAPNAFLDIVNLEVLMVEHNELEVVFPNQFTSSKNLKTLSINDNALIDFHTQHFPALTSLKINQNNLSSFPELKAPSLMFVHASENAIERLTAQELRGIPNLVHLDLSMNQVLSNISFSIFKETQHLSYLNFAYNKVDKFVDHILPSLDTLILQSNYISEISQPVSLYLPAIQQIDLSLNNIVDLDPAMFNTSTTLYSLNFAGNNFLCDCGLVELVNWMLQRMADKEIDIVGAETYMCESPEQYIFEIVVNVVPSLKCPPVIPATADITVDVLFVLLTCIVVLGSIGIACYCRRRPHGNAVSSASSLTDDDHSHHHSPLHCCSYICTRFCTSNILDYHRGRSHRDRVMSDDERRDLMVGSPLTSPSDPEPPELML